LYIISRIITITITVIILSHPPYNRLPPPMQHLSHNRQQQTISNNTKWLEVKTGQKTLATHP
jgi:hypothetical protein